MSIIFLIVVLIVIYMADRRARQVPKERPKPLCKCQMCHDIYYFGYARNVMDEKLVDHKKFLEDLEKGVPHDIR